MLDASSARAVPVGTWVAPTSSGDPVRYRAFCTDFDGTLAEEGVVRPEATAALSRLRARDYRLVLATGRIVEDLLATFPDSELFDRIVAENGAVAFSPGPAPTERVLARRPPPELADALRARGVRPLVQGRVVLATTLPHEATCLSVIRERGLELELEVSFNHGALMLLPSGTNKATGLLTVLSELAVHPLETVAVGDAENDVSLLDACGFRVAVANAIPAVKERAHVVTRAERGRGVVEIVERLLAQ